MQPKEILEFFRDLIATHGMTIETAGSLKDGKRIWALAASWGSARWHRERVAATLLGPSPTH